MKELNEETAYGVVQGLTLINNFGKVNCDVNIEITRLALFMYNYTIEEWLFGVAEMLFTSGIEFISKDYVTDVKEICNVINKFDTSVAEQYYNDFLVTYGYDEDADKTVFKSQKFKDDFEEFYISLNIERIEFIAPLIKANDILCQEFLSHVPVLVENHFKLRGYILVDIDIMYNTTYNKNTVVMYINYDRESNFSDELYVPDLMEDFEYLLHNFHTDSSKK